MFMRLHVYIEYFSFYLFIAASFYEAVIVLVSVQTLVFSFSGYYSLWREGGFKQPLLQIAMERKIIELDQGWAYMLKGITKLKRILEGLTEDPFSSEDYIFLYTYPFAIS